MPKHMRANKRREAVEPPPDHGSDGVAAKFTAKQVGGKRRRRRSEQEEDICRRDRTGKRQDWRGEKTWHGHARSPCRGYSIGCKYCIEVERVNTIYERMRPPANGPGEKCWVATDADGTPCNVTDHEPAKQEQRCTEIYHGSKCVVHEDDAPARNGWARHCARIADGCHRYNPRSWHPLFAGNQASNQWGNDRASSKPSRSMMLSSGSARLAPTCLPVALCESRTKCSAPCR